MYHKQNYYPETACLSIQSNKAYNYYGNANFLYYGYLNPTFPSFKTLFYQIYVYAIYTWLSELSHSSMFAPKFLNLITP